MPRSRGTHPKGRRQRTSLLTRLSGWITFPRVVTGLVGAMVLLYFVVIPTLRRVGRQYGRELVGRLTELGGPPAPSWKTLDPHDPADLRRHLATSAFGYAARHLEQDAVELALDRLGLDGRSWATEFLAGGWAWDEIRSEYGGDRLTHLVLERRDLGAGIKGLDGAASAVWGKTRASLSDTECILLGAVVASGDPLHGDQVPESAVRLGRSVVSRLAFKISTTDFEALLARTNTWPSGHDWRLSGGQKFWAVFAIVVVLGIAWLYHTGHDNSRTAWEPRRPPRPQRYETYDLGSSRTVGSDSRPEDAYDPDEAGSVPLLRAGTWRTVDPIGSRPYLEGRRDDQTVGRVVETAGGRVLLDAKGDRAGTIEPDTYRPWLNAEVIRGTDGMVAERIEDGPNGDRLVYKNDQLVGRITKDFWGNPIVERDEEKD